MGQDQVSGGVSVPCWHATPVAYTLWKPLFGKLSNPLISSPVKMSQTGAMSGLKMKNICKSQKGQDQVSRGVSVLCWHAAPVGNVLWKPLVIRLKVKFGNKVKISNRVKNWCYAWSMEGVTVDGHHPECRVTFGRGGPRIVDKIPVPTIELP